MDESNDRSQEIAEWLEQSATKLAVKYGMTHATAKALLAVTPSGI